MADEATSIAPASHARARVHDVPSAAIVVPFMLKKLLMLAITSGFAAKLLQRLLERNAQRPMLNGSPSSDDGIDGDQSPRQVDRPPWDVDTSR